MSLGALERHVKKSVLTVSVGKAGGMVKMTATGPDFSANRAEGFEVVFGFEGSQLEKSTHEPLAFLGEKPKSLKIGQRFRLWGSHEARCESSSQMWQPTRTVSECNTICKARANPERVASPRAWRVGTRAGANRRTLPLSATHRIHATGSTGIAFLSELSSR